MIIKNGNVFCDASSFQKKDLIIENDIIIDIVDCYSGNDTDIINANDFYIIPGLVDIHSHGAIGCDFSDGDVDGLLKILAFEKNNGITSYCPTSMTLKKDELAKIFASAAEAINKQSSKHARIAGINMEGPFIDPVKKGAHVENNIISPDIDFFRFCNKECNNQIKLVTLAPNTPGALEFIDELKDEVNISLGHTSADYATNLMAFEHGANHVTHLYNAMPAFEHRKPGLIGAASDYDNVIVELICDGIHIDASVVRATFKLFDNRVALISDSMRATGLENGIYDLGGQSVNVDGKLATLSDGTIAGSATCLFDCMKKAISFGIPAEKAIAAATSIPAKSIGRNDIGVISKGKIADLLIVDKEWNLVQVI